MGRDDPHTRLAPGLCCRCQCPSLAQGAQLETPRPLRQPPPAHELAGFLGLSLTGKCPRRLKIAQRSPAKEPAPTAIPAVPGEGPFYEQFSHSWTHRPSWGFGTPVSPCPQRGEPTPAWGWQIGEQGHSRDMGAWQESSPPTVVPKHNTDLPAPCCPTVKRWYLCATRAMHERGVPAVLPSCHLHQADGSVTTWPTCLTSALLCSANTLGELGHLWGVLQTRYQDCDRNAGDTHPG